MFDSIQLTTHTNKNKLWPHCARAHTQAFTCTACHSGRLQCVVNEL